MKVLIDTNILISAALNPNGTPFKAYLKAVTYPSHGMVCEQNIDEMRRIYNRKFPKKIADFERFLSMALMTLELVPIPEEEDYDEQKIRDENDRTILRAAIRADADVILTGDRDFLESGIKNPKIMTAAEFLEW
ncbi:MAG: putative toxin-antitoxin system toxin component, PIN family [Oscillospiraceae bacterium]|nr:putative toxin-antitoxin system toxin component, PIN family [Oscillospiraceae bacterium]